MVDYTERLKEFIVENFLFGDAGQLTWDTSFLDSGIVDSTGMLELVKFLEEAFDITVQDDEFIPENLDSIENLNRFLGRKLDGKRHQGCAG
jgi:acyl carrier protein